MLLDHFIDVFEPLFILLIPGVEVDNLNRLTDLLIVEVQEVLVLHYFPPHFSSMLHCLLQSSCLLIFLHVGPEELLQSIIVLLKCFFDTESSLSADKIP